MGLLFSLSGMQTDCDRSKDMPLDFGVEGASWELEQKGSGGRFLARFTTSGEGSAPGLLLWNQEESVVMW